MKAIDDTYLKGIAKIIDRLHHGPGCEKGSTHYASAVQGEYEFLRKKVLEVTKDFQEAIKREKNKTRPDPNWGSK